MPMISRIFYIDDDHDDQLFFSMALNEARPTANLHSFYSCGDVLTYLKDENKELPDIIFFDQNMPGNLENECLKEIKRIARVQHIPVIMYTTGGHPRLVGDALEGGAYKYVFKSITVEEMRENLSALIAECEQLPS